MVALYTSVNMKSFIQQALTRESKFNTKWGTSHQLPHCTDLRRRRVTQYSISENDDDVAYVRTIARRCSQHRSTNIAKRKVRVHIASVVTKCWDGWLDCGDRRMCAQVKSLCGVNVIRILGKTDACVDAVNVQSTDKLRQKRLHQFEIAGTDTSRLIHNKNDVNGTVCGRICNVIYPHTHLSCV